MLPERDRMSAFREEFARQVLSMDVVDLSGGKPRIDIVFLKLGPVAVGGTVATACEFIRNAHQTKDGVNDFQLLVVGRGPARAHQAGRDLAFDPGSGALFDYGRPFRASPVNGGAGYNVAVPPALLKALVAHPEDRAGRVVRPGPALRLLDGYLASLLALDAPPPAELAHRIGLHLLDLVAAVLGPTNDAREVIAGRGLKAARRRAILAEIARRCGDPALDIDSIASQEGLSRRSVERLLGETGKSFTEHLTERRLERAYAMLIDPALSCRRIIDIALAAGFGDVSHFNRLFRRRFGETPSSARTAAGSSAAVED
jgi:AraC-like DNA-binding protein